jgi:hypothetical protein
MRIKVEKPSAETIAEMTGCPDLVERGERL